MIGRVERSWSSLHNVVVPALVVMVEAGVASVWIGVLAHTRGLVAVDVPYLCLAVPGILAVALSGYTARLAWPTWVRVVVVALTAGAGVALTAGVVGAAYLHGSLLAIGAHPWTVTGQVASAEASLAWLVAALAWVAGIWVGWEEPTLSHALYAVVLATAGFVLFFLVDALHHPEASLGTQRWPATVLVLVLFPAAIATIALLYERDLEKETLRHRRTRPSLAFLAAVVVPMVAVALVGVLVALLVGPLASPLGRGAREGARLVAVAIVALAGLLGRLFHPVTIRPRRLITPKGAALQGAARLSGHVPVWALAVATALGAVLVGVLAFFLIRALSGMKIHLRRPPRKVVPGLVEDKDSVFSWRHLLDQLLALIRRRATSGRPVPGAAGLVVDEEAAGAESIRAHYRRLLLAARSAGHGRHPAETPLELARRLAPVAGSAAEAPLSDLTLAYDRVRYGAEPTGQDDLSQAALDATSVVAALAEPPEDPLGGGAVEGFTPLSSTGR